MHSVRGAIAARRLHAKPTRTCTCIRSPVHLRTAFPNPAPTGSPVLIAESVLRHPFQHHHTWQLTNRRPSSAALNPIDATDEPTLPFPFCTCSPTIATSPTSPPALAFACYQCGPIYCCLRSRPPSPRIPVRCFLVPTPGVLPRGHLVSARPLKPEASAWEDRCRAVPAIDGQVGWARVRWASFQRAVRITTMP